MRAVEKPSRVGSSWIEIITFRARRGGTFAFIGRNTKHSPNFIFYFNYSTYLNHSPFERTHKNSISTNILLFINVLNFSINITQTTLPTLTYPSYPIPTHQTLLKPSLVYLSNPIFLPLIIILLVLYNFLNNYFSNFFFVESS